MTEMAKFQSSTMLENYKRLLSYIESQMDTDEVDYTERKAGTLQTYIEYYLEHMSSDYKIKVFKIVPYEILKEKILDVPFGFGNKDCEWEECYFDNAACIEDMKLYTAVKNNLYDEIEYCETRCKCATIDTTKFYQCWLCTVRDCGCKAEPSCCGSY